jgi:L-fuconolactonase
MLNDLNGYRRISRYASCERLGKGVNLVVGSNALHQPHSVGFRRVNQIAGEQHPVRIAIADHPWQQLRVARAAIPAELNLSGPKFRLRRGDANVAHERQFESSADAITADHGDHRLSDRTDRVCVINPISELPVVAVLLKHGDVASCGESFSALAGKDDHPDSVILIDSTLRIAASGCMRVDAHQHFWQWSKGWFSRPEPVLSRDYLPTDLEPLLKAQRVDKTVVVQTSPTVGETDYLLDLAQTSTFIGGVVGWLDLESPHFAEELNNYRRKSFFAGVRPMLQCLPNDDWVMHPRVLDSLSLIAQLGVPFEFLVLTQHLPYVLKVLERIPNLRAVIDHIAKPPIKAGTMQLWQDLMSEVALHPNVYCKLSGMVTEADHQHWDPEQLRPYANHVLAHFGAERIMFGSDWPVCLLAASYQQVWSITQNYVTSHLGKDALEPVFGGNAARFYRLEG